MPAQLVTGQSLRLRQTMFLFRDQRFLECEIQAVSVYTLFGRSTEAVETIVMHVTLVHVSVKSEDVQAFVEATRVNHEASILESGNCRFDILQDPDDPTRFILYEAYRSEADALAHKETDHYLAWRETVADMMAEPRRGEPLIGLFPSG